MQQIHFSCCSILVCATHTHNLCVMESKEEKSTPVGIAVYCACMFVLVNKTELQNKNITCQMLFVRYQHCNTALHPC